MKRLGNLWPAVIERGNLLRAFHQAARGKRRKQEVRRFAENLDENLDRLRQELMDRRFETGKFNVFMVYDPKERTIHAARFPERVFHHALMNLCEPVLERQAVFHSYACRKGKGRLKAIDAAQTAARGRAWHLKLDIRKYFESIPQERLISRLQRLFKDPEVLHWLEKIIRGRRTAILAVAECGLPACTLQRQSHTAGRMPARQDRLEACPPLARGLPIGSLTSQHLANFYLGPLDRFCQGHPAVKAYCRYMDDFVCWGDDKAAMIALGREIQCFVESELELALKHPPCPQPTLRGMDFLGYRIFPSHAELNRRSKVRYWRKLRLLDALHEDNMISEQALQERLTALTAFVLPVRSHGFRRGVMEKFRSAAIGLEPGEPGRQLEQQREQLPRREPQQQQPDQQQQQHRVPLGSQLRPMGMDFPGMSMGLNRPPSRSHPLAGCDKMTKRPPGAGSPVDAGSNAPGGWMVRFAACLALLWPATVAAVVVGVTHLDGSRLLGQSFGGVGTLEIVESGGSYRGTGVLLNDRWVLTAAHNWDAGAVTQLAFSINGQRHQAAEWIQHPGWDGSFSPSQGWDVGLVRLAQPVAGFGTTKLYAGSSELGMSLTVLGTGLAGLAGGSLDSNLNGTVFGFTNTIDRVISLGGPYGSGGLLIYDFDNGLAAKNSLALAAAYDAFGQPVAGGGNILGSGSSMSMTGLEGTSALGDSGGPAYADFGDGPELVGIVSWGVNPTEPGNLYGSGYGDAGYLMRVSSLNGWITSTIPEPGTAVLMIAGWVVCLRRRRW